MKETKNTQEAEKMSSKLYVKNKYGVVPNKLLNDPNVSFKAKGLYAYLQSKPDGWKFSKERIAKQTSDGKEAIKSGLQELENAGYLIRKPMRDEKGMWCGYYYELLDNPSADNQPTDCRSTDNIAALSNKENSNKEYSKKEIEGNTPEKTYFSYPQQEESLTIPKHISNNYDINVISPLLNVFKIPTMPVKIAAIEDLIRQGVSIHEIREALIDKSSWDFWSVIHSLKPKRYKQSQPTHMTAEHIKKILTDR